jgi:hypothetical protein
MEEGGVLEAPQHRGERGKRGGGKTGTRYYSPQLFLVIFLAAGFVFWGLFSYDQRRIVQFFRGKPKGRKYLEEPAADSVSAEKITLYVLPGGGSGVGDEGEGVLNYPEWARRRTVAAAEHAKANQLLLPSSPPASFSELERVISAGAGAGAGAGAAAVAGKPSSVTNPSHDPNPTQGAFFLALSAGSLNAPNRLDEGGGLGSGASNRQIIFESTFMIKHLLELGVPRARIFGDFMSWDTVTNAMVLRMTIKGLLQQKFGYEGEGEGGDAWGSAFGDSSTNPTTMDVKMPARAIDVEIFISDFHLERVQAAVEWVLSLSPSLTPAVNIHMHSVGSEGIPGLSFFGAPDKYGNPAPVSESAKADFMVRALYFSLSPFPPPPSSSSSSIITIFIIIIIIIACNMLCVVSRRWISCYQWWPSS